MAPLASAALTSGGNAALREVGQGFRLRFPLVAVAGDTPAANSDPSAGGVGSGVENERYRHGHCGSGVRKERRNQGPLVQRVQDERSRQVTLAPRFRTNVEVKVTLPGTVGMNVEVKVTLPGTVKTNDRGKVTLEIAAVLNVSASRECSPGIGAGVAGGSSYFGSTSRPDELLRWYLAEARPSTWSLSDCGARRRTTSRWSPGDGVPAGTRIGQTPCLTAACRFRLPFVTNSIGTRYVIDRRRVAKLSHRNR